MFENLTNRLSKTFKNIIGIGRLTEDNIKETLHEVRIALLEADVAVSVVRHFTKCVKEKAIGQEVNKRMTPGQEFIKIVRNELIATMGEKNNNLNLSTVPPAVILLVGLQGTGKTTSTVKLAKFLTEKYKKKVLTVSTDIYRPAAIKQLEILSRQINIDCYASNCDQTPINIVQNALKEAKIKFFDILLVDTAGRLHINECMMEEIKQIYNTINPIETLFVVDAMMGQDIANVATIFDKALSFTGIILTKVDSDTRGGVALSIRHITGKPIKFIGVGEKPESLEPFYPDRIASRILGMGDVISLIENIESKIDSEQVKRFTKKMNKGDVFDFNDFLQQLEQIRKMGNISDLVKKIPGLGKISYDVQSEIDDKILIHMEAIINSMTIKERKKPEIIKGSRKRRIAHGSGMKVQDVNRLLKQFTDMQNIIKKMKKSGIGKISRYIKGIIPQNFYKR
ncbi:signal recognition particle protein [Candidatus Pantoea edessiphila]|uniref:Signal recognition particle protein n=1 Tax=Candidatus Pantoea edessiphila TaxID=2044610 RepID=A0A2P5SXP7_9GAMM|nr:signal recognition particle protein [Candidatus Pantoea edessiphila]MBK4775669.1 signal recognition particle protein [Pantoea sp. Edef]PPI87109.1 signal recognition particle protein [Candidatus Pantoea edessiphila]